MVFDSVIASIYILYIWGLLPYKATPCVGVAFMILRGLQIGIRSVDIAESTLNNIV